MSYTGKRPQQKHTQHATSTKTESDHLYSWTTKIPAKQKISPTDVEPHRYSWERRRRRPTGKRNLGTRWTYFMRQGSTGGNFLQWLALLRSQAQTHLKQWGFALCERRDPSFLWNHRCSLSCGLNQDFSLHNFHSVFYRSAPFLLPLLSPACLKKASSGAWEHEELAQGPTTPKVTQSIKAHQPKRKPCWLDRRLTWPKQHSNPEQQRPWNLRLDALCFVSCNIIPVRTKNHNHFCIKTDCFKRWNGVFTCPNLINTMTTSPTPLPIHKHSTSLH